MITDIIRPYILWFKTLLKIHYIQKDHYLYVIMALTTIKINLKMYTIFRSSLNFLLSLLSINIPKKYLNEILIQLLHVLGI